LLSTADQFRTASVPLDVADNSKKVIVRLNWERLEASLVEVPRSERDEVGMPPHGVRVCEPPNELRQLAVSSRPDHHVPVIGHYGIADQPRRMFDHCLIDYPLEGVIVSVAFKER
jgi:hypothetical protein